MWVRNAMLSVVLAILLYVFFAPTHGDSYLKETNPTSSEPISTSRQSSELASQVETKVTPRRKNRIDCTKPTQAAFQKSEQTLHYGMFYLNLHADELPEDFVHQLKPRLRSIQHYYQLLLGKASLKAVEVDLYLFSDLQSYQQFAQSQDRSHEALGSYSLYDGKIVFYYRNAQQAINTSIHEIVHAVNHRLLGYLPGWLNEGLAEFFAGLWQSESGQINAESKKWIDGKNRLRFKPLDLPELFNQETYWYRDAQREKLRLYGSSWLLIYFFFVDERGQRLLSTIMQQEMQDPCDILEGNEMLQFLLDAEPNFELDYQHWLSSQLSY